MEPERFDHLTRGLAARGSRRNVLRGLSGLTAAGIAALGLGHQARLTRALQDATSTEEESVILYEQLAGIAHNHHGGNCADLRAKTAAFLADHAGMVAAHKKEQDAWSHDRKVQHADTYGDRLQAASEALLAALARCEFVKYDASALPATPVATPAGIGPGTTHGWRQEATPVVDPREGDEEAAAPTPTIWSIPRSDVPINPGLGPECGGNDVTIYCHNASTGKDTPTFTGQGICSSSTHCQICADSSYCYYLHSDICPTESACTVVWVKPDCCTKNCPISASDCAINWAGGLTTPDECLQCMTSWCGSTSYCLKNCEANDCCNEPCSSSTPPPPPEGGP